ncbi:MAG: hypothetical protein NZ927_01460 [Candidatus Calescibacterium sp.]|nr:hypothetical protein [Candidatus Calescibacterium sp.]MCX7733622.1 hypothetical protein [bacterium]MDW8087193.1 hypothetical protein [Candidatus Calescibacterium sp.]
MLRKDKEQRKNQTRFQIIQQQELARENKTIAQQKSLAIQRLKKIG